MKRFLLHSLKVLFIVCLCSGLLISCSDDDDDDNRDSITASVSNDDPSYGFMMNSTDYRLLIDLNEKEEYEIALNPGQIIDMRLRTMKTHLLHVIVLDGNNRAISDYTTSFYIDNVPLDNQLKDFVCNWYVEFTEEYPFTGFANNFGT